MSTLLDRIVVTGAPGEAPSRKVLDGLTANELIFAVVGPVGSGTSEIAGTLDELLRGSDYDTNVLRARDVIEEHASTLNRPITGENEIQRTQALQDAGDFIRKKCNDNAAVAVGLVHVIRTTRATKQGKDAAVGVPIPPNGERRAYILDSIRHPDEIALLRRVYQEAFCLIGVFCHEEERLRRLRDKKYTHASQDTIGKFMRRDENAPEDYGQKVSEAFHLSDYFVDNSVDRFEQNGEANPDWNLPEQLGRLVDILTRSRIVPPWPHETGMFHAYGARMQSRCLSRQVGAALLDRKGAVVATGTNEVPRAGGGLYGGILSPNQSRDPDPNDDFRCFVHNRYCTNTRQQNEIIDELIMSIDELDLAEDKDELRRRIRQSRIGKLLEFSRSVHAEMDALLSAGRSGISTVGTRLLVTTFPCHSCARHIVAAGVEEVQYIEPYLKSQAIPLHGDSIVTDPKNWSPPTRLDTQPGTRPNVLFRAFIGVAPRLYRRAFLMDTELKDHNTGSMVMPLGSPRRHEIVDTLRLSYADVEARLPSLSGE